MTLPHFAALPPQCKLVRDLLPFQFFLRVRLDPGCFPLIFLWIRKILPHELDAFLPLFLPFILLIIVFFFISSQKLQGAGALAFRCCICRRFSPPPPPYEHTCFGQLLFPFLRVSFLSRVEFFCPMGPISQFLLLVALPHYPPKASRTM